MAIALLAAAALTTKPADFILIDKSDRRITLYAGGAEVARGREGIRR